MDRQLSKFINGEVNIVQLNDVLLSREKNNKGMEYIHIKPTGCNDDLYTFWHNPYKNKPKDPNKPARHTGGGKKAYVMVMLEKLKEINDSEIVGDLVRLSEYIEWGTGRLIDKRKKTPLRFDDIKKIFKCSNGNLTKRINKMKDYNLLEHKTEGYFISPDFIKKGGAKDV